MFPNLEVSLRSYKRVKMIMFFQFHMLQFLRCLWDSYDGFLFIYEIKMMKFCFSCQYVIYTGHLNDILYIEFYIEQKELRT